MKLIFAILMIALLASVAKCQTPSFGILQTDDEWLSEVYYPATVLLYREDVSGNMKFTCTATAFEKVKDVYHFVTDAHCTSETSKDEKTVKIDRVFFFVARDNDTEQKHYLKAKVIAAGMQQKGDDFSVLEVKTDEDIATVPLGVDPTSRVGEPIVNISGPLGLGKQVFRGNVSNPKVDRPIEQDDISWSNMIAIQSFGIDGGSSGSSIVCLKQRAICGFIEGTLDDTTVIASPVSKFKEWYAAEKAGTYPYFDAESLHAQTKAEHAEKLDKVKK